MQVQYTIVQWNGQWSDPMFPEITVEYASAEEAHHLEMLLGLQPIEGCTTYIPLNEAITALDVLAQNIKWGFKTWPGMILHPMMQKAKTKNATHLRINT